MKYLSMARAKEFRRRDSRIYESVIIKSAQNPKDKDVFLSHSSKDKDSLADVIAFLESFGAQVYIDKEDTALPENTSRETAEGLKKQIKACRRLVILASTNSKSSRWIPWEIGLADALKDLDSVAILPLTAGDDESVEKWPEQEYLGLYRQIVEHKLTGEEGAQWLVRDPVKNVARKLRKWLAG